MKILATPEVHPNMPFLNLRLFLRFVQSIVCGMFFPPNTLLMPLHLTDKTKSIPDMTDCMKISLVVLHQFAGPHLNNRNPPRPKRTFTQSEVKSHQGGFFGMVLFMCMGAQGTDKSEQIKEMKPMTNCELNSRHSSSTEMKEEQNSGKRENTSREE